MGVIVGLQALKERCEVLVVTDSEYVVKGLENGWAMEWRERGWRTAEKKPAKNVDLWSELLSLCDTHAVRLQWVRGHAGHPENERCDALANSAATNSALAVDSEYETSIADANNRRVQQ